MSNNNRLSEIEMGQAMGILYSQEGFRFPDNHKPVLLGGANEIEWNSYSWNPPDYSLLRITFSVRISELDPLASPKPTWQELCRAAQEGKILGLIDRFQNNPRRDDPIENSLNNATEQLGNTPVGVEGVFAGWNPRRRGHITFGRYRTFG